MKIKAGKHKAFEVRFAAYSYTRREDWRFCLPTFGAGREDDGSVVVYFSAFFWAAGFYVKKVEESDEKD